MTRTVVQLRLSGREKAIWQESAKTARMSLSEWVRRKLGSTARPAVRNTDVPECRFGGCARLGKNPCNACRIAN